ncbi:MAG: V-type ATP synthase subunit E [Nanobdellota archaeon]
MGFKQLKESITQKTDKEADKIVKSARKEAEEAKRKLEIEMEEYEQKVMEDAKSTINMMEKREIASAGLEAKKKKLIAKKQLLEEAFENAKTQIDKTLKKNDRKKLIEKILKEIEKEIDIGKIYCNKADSELVPAKKVHKKEMLGGLIAEDKKGEVIIDYSFESIFEEIKSNYMSEITSILMKQ